MVLLIIVAVLAGIKYNYYLQRTFNNTVSGKYCHQGPKTGEIFLSKLSARTKG